MRLSHFALVVATLAVESHCSTLLDKLQNVLGIDSLLPFVPEIINSQPDHHGDANLGGIQHYTSVSQDVWPIDLDQYRDQVVYRITYDDEVSRKDLLKALKKVPSADIWAKSMSKKFIDVRFANMEFATEFFTKVSELPEEELFTFDVEPLITDLPQAIFETYHNGAEVEAEAEGEQQEDEFSVETVDVFFKAYRPLKTIYAWIDLIAETYPNLVTVELVGQTFEGRDLKAIHFSTQDHADQEKRRTVVITGGLHAREWVSVSSTLYMMHELLRRYDEGRAKELFFLENLDFIFVPVMNPDGYEYSWTNDRLWRKNRQDTISSNCFGIDIDHSFDYHWQRSDDSPCGEDYSGEESFESIESEIWNNYINSTKAHLTIDGYIDLHSYAQEILYPYAYSCDQIPRDAENLIELAYGLSKAIRLKSGKHYDVLGACLDKDVDLMPSLGGGSALDFMYHKRAYWAFQIKLRDSGSHGFLLPPKYIVPVGKEIFGSIRYFCNFILNNT